MADDQDQDTETLTVLDECGQDNNETVEGEEDGDGEGGEDEKGPTDDNEKSEESKGKGKKPRKKQRRYDEDDEMDDDAEDASEEEDDEQAEERRVNPRLHLIAGPLLFRDLCNLKELRISIRQSESFEARFFRMKDKVGLRKPKRGFARLSFKNANMAYWILDTLRGIHIPRARAATIGCWMMTKDIAIDLMHNAPDNVEDIKKRLEELEVDDISQRALHIGNLPRNITEEKLKEFITEAQEIHLPKFRGNPRGYAFVEFESKEQAEECFKTYQSKKLDNNTLSIRKIGSGKTALLLKSGDMGGRMMRGGRGGNRGRGRGGRRRSPNRRYQGPVWDSWGREDRKRRFSGPDRDYMQAEKYPRGGARDYGRRDFGRRDRMDDWERDFRRDYRERIGLDELRYGFREDFSRDYMGGGGGGGRSYDRGYSDAWASGSAFSRPY